MLGMTTQAIIGIALTLLAFMLAIVMTVVNVSRSESDSERRFVISACSVSWLLVALALVLVLLLPRPYKYIPLGLVIVAFPAVIYRMSLRHQLLREKERRHSERVERESLED
jgi:amino acid transporter